MSPTLVVLVVGQETFFERITQFGRALQVRLGVAIELLTLMINDASQRVGSTNPFEHKRPRGSIDNDDPTTRETLEPPLIGVRNVHVDQLNRTHPSSGNAAELDNSLTRHDNLVRAPTPQSTGQNGRTRRDKENREERRVLLGPTPRRGGRP